MRPFIKILRPLVVVYSIVFVALYRTYCSQARSDAASRSGLWSLPATNHVEYS